MFLASNFKLTSIFSEKSNRWEKTSNTFDSSFLNLTLNISSDLKSVISFSRYSKTAQRDIGIGVRGKFDKG